MADAAALDRLARLLDVMHRLRGPDGCPWDREQTPHSLRAFVVEEAYEVVEAIEAGDPRALCQELGDLLLQVVFQAEIASERGDFDMGDVAEAIVEKLVRRHPHVFAGERVYSASEVVRNWQRIKAEERTARRQDGLLQDLPRALPALARAQAIATTLAQLGFDWVDASGVLAKIDEERSELSAALARGDRQAVAHELGDLLLALTALARHLEVDAELALRDATARLLARVRHVEAAVRAAGGTLHGLAAEDRDRLWAEAKHALRAAPSKV